MTSPRKDAARLELQEGNLHLKLARYTATLDLYNEIGAQRDLARVASLLAVRLKYIADVRAYRFIATDMQAAGGGPPADAGVVLWMEGSEAHWSAFTELLPEERDVMTRCLPVDFEQEQSGRAAPFGALPELAACRRIAALPHRLEDGFIGVLVVGHQEQLSMLERKLLYSVTQLLCKSVATARRELMHLELVERQNDQLTQANEELGQLVESLSTVICPIWDRVLLVPIVGTIDERRSGKLVARLLARIHEQGTRHVVLDLTGVAAIDPKSCGWLTTLSEMLGLLGARCIIVGIRPGLAAALAPLGSMTRRALFCGSIQEAMQLFCTART